MGFRPGTLWAVVSASAEALGGALMIGGLGGPIGPGIVAANLTVASITAHLPRGFWNTKGGVVFTVSLVGVTIAAALLGYGAWSLDALFAVALPAWFPVTWGVVMVVGVLAAIASRRQPPVRVEKRAAA